MESTTRNVTSTTDELSQLQIQLIMDQIESAVALIHEENGSILYGNAALLKLTAFTQEELGRLGWHSLLGIDEAANLPFLEPETCTLTRRKRDAIPVMVRAVRLILEKPYVIVAIFPKIPFHQQRYEEFEFLEENLGKLLNLSRINDPYVYLNEVASLLAMIFNVDHIAIYQGVKDFPILKNVIVQSDETALPDTLPSSELGQLETIGLWAPGKTILSELHKKARESQLAYLANAALGEDEALFGLIVLGSSIHEPIRNIKIHLEFIARIVSATLQQTILVNNLYQQVQDQKKRLDIHDLLFDNIHEGIVILDQDLLVQQVNQPAEVLLGYADREVNGQSVENVLIGAEGLNAALQSIILAKWLCTSATGWLFPANCR